MTDSDSVCWSSATQVQNRDRFCALTQVSSNEDFSLTARSSRKIEGAEYPVKAKKESTDLYGWCFLFSLQYIGIRTRREKVARPSEENSSVNCFRRRGQRAQRGKAHGSVWHKPNRTQKTIIYTHLMSLLKQFFFDGLY